MSIALKEKKQHIKVGNESVIRHVAIADRGSVIPWDRVAEQIALRTNCNVHQIKCMMSGMTDALCSYLSEGHSVRLAEFGTLMPTIRSSAVENSKDIKANKISVSFYPSGKLQQQLKLMSVSSATPPPRQQAPVDPSQTSK